MFKEPSGEVTVHTSFCAMKEEILSTKLPPFAQIPYETHAGNKLHINSPVGEIFLGQFELLTSVFSICFVFRHPASCDIMLSWGISALTGLHSHLRAWKTSLLPCCSARRRLDAGWRRLNSSLVLYYWTPRCQMCWGWSWRGRGVCFCWIAVSWMNKWDSERRDINNVKTLLLARCSFFRTTSVNCTNVFQYVSLSNHLSIKC